LPFEAIFAFTFSNDQSAASSELDDNSTKSGFEASKLFVEYMAIRSSNLVAAHSVVARHDKSCDNTFLAQLEEKAVKIHLNKVFST
jgi:hypothetical protein